MARGSTARFSGPQGVAVDSSGDVYVADTHHNTIRKITPAGVVTTLAGLADVGGSADSTGSAAQFSYPGGVAVDSSGTVYLANTGNNTIRKVSGTGVVTTLAAIAGILSQPTGVAVDKSGTVYVAGWTAISRITPAGVVTALAGQSDTGSADGTGTAASFGNLEWGRDNDTFVVGPFGLAVDNQGNVFVADTGNSTIRKITPAGVVTTLAGNPGTANGLYFGGSAGYADGTGRAALFGGPQGVAVDSAGNLYVADSRNNTIRKGYPALLLQNSELGFGFNSGQFSFSLAGPAGRPLVVEASTDLVLWQPIWTNSVGGTLNFIDPQSGAFSKRFYRLARPQ